MTMDNIYIWLRPNAILVSRGLHEEAAIAALRSVYHESILVEKYHIMSYDGYYSSADVVLVNADESHLPQGMRHARRCAVILENNAEFKPRSYDVVGR